MIVKREQNTSFKGTILTLAILLLPVLVCSTASGISIPTVSLQASFQVGYSTPTDSTSPYYPCQFGCGVGGALGLGGGARPMEI